MPWKHVTPDSEAEVADFARRFEKKSRFLLDDNMPEGLTKGIKALGWNATTRRQLGSQRREDEDLLALAHETDRILLTSDRDFRDEWRFPPHRNPGVVILPSAAGGDERLFDALAAVLQLVGSYRELFRGSVVEVDGDGAFTITDRDFDTGARTRKRYRFDRSGKLQQWAF